MLKTAVPSAWRHRRLRSGIAGAAVVAVAVAALVLLSASSDTPSAYAVETQSGEVSIEIRSLEDANGLEEALDSAGIPASVEYLRAGMACEEPRFESVPWPEGTRAIIGGPVSGNGPPFISGPFRFVVSRNAVGAGQSLVVTASASGKGLFGVDVQVAIAEGPVAPCEPVPAGG